MFRPRQLSLLLLMLLLVTACAPVATPTPYPAYDPFSPVNGNSASPVPIQEGQILSPSRVPGGPTPTRAPLSVVIPKGGSSSSFSQPTPDAPHPLPPPRDYVELYTVQPGDTLGSIAQNYGISLDTLLQANGLDEFSILSVGITLNIPPVTTDAAPGSSFKIIPDSELVNGPATIDFDLDVFLANRNGYLSHYVQDVNGEYLTGAEIISRISKSYSINPRLLVALLEYRSGWVTNPAPENIDYPLGNYDSFRAGLYRQAAWTADNLNRGYYLWRVNALSSLPLADGSYIPMDDPNDQAAGWAAALVLIAFVLVMNVLAKFFASRKRRQLEGI